MNVALEMLSPSLKSWGLHQNVHHEPAPQIFRGVGSMWMSWNLWDSRIWDGYVIVILILLMSWKSGPPWIWDDCVCHILEIVVIYYIPRHVMYGCWRCCFHWAVGWCWVKFEKQPRWEAPFIVEGPVSWGCLGMVNEWPPWCNDHWDIVRYTLEFRMLPSCIFFSLAVWSCLIWGMVRNGNWWRLDLWRSSKKLMETGSLMIFEDTQPGLLSSDSVSIPVRRRVFKLRVWSMDCGGAPSTASSGSVLTTMMDESQDGRSLHDGQLEESAFH